MIYELIIIIILVFSIYLLIMANIRYRKMIKIITDENVKLKENNKILKYNYDSLLKVYKSTLNKMKNLQVQLKKGKVK